MIPFVEFISACAIWRVYRLQSRETLPEKVSFPSNTVVKGKLTRAAASFERDSIKRCRGFAEDWKI